MCPIEVNSFPTNHLDPLMQDKGSKRQFQAKLCFGGHFGPECGANGGKIREY